MLTFTCPYYEGKNVPSYSKDVFTPEWADKLYRGVERNCRMPFRFVVVTDEPQSSFAEPVETLEYANYHNNMWCIIECLRVTGDPVIFMGLDTVITGDITFLADARPRFAMTHDPYHKARMCSGVMMWSDTTELYERFVSDPHKNDEKYRLGRAPSDMKWLEVNGRPDLDLNEAFPGRIRSYKKHIRDRGLKDARIVYFHGKPKPHELPDDDPVKKMWNGCSGGTEGS